MLRHPHTTISKQVWSSLLMLRISLMMRHSIITTSHLSSSMLSQRKDQLKEEPKSLLSDQISTTQEISLADSVNTKSQPSSYLHQRSPVSLLLCQTQALLNLRSLCTLVSTHPLCNIFITRIQLWSPFLQLVDQVPDTPRSQCKVITLWTLAIIPRFVFSTRRFS